MLRLEIFDGVSMCQFRFKEMGLLRLRRLSVEIPVKSMRGNARSVIARPHSMEGGGASLDNPACLRLVLEVSCVAGSV